MCIYRQHLVGGLVYVYLQTTPGWRVGIFEGLVVGGWEVVGWGY